MKLKKLLYLAIFIFLFFSLTKNIFDYQKSVNFYQSYKDDFEKAKKKNITLRTQILKSKDPNEVEKTLRNKLNYLKAGEISVIIPNPTPTPQIITPTPAPVYQQWLKLFFEQ